MGKFATEHADALADIETDGMPVTFSRATTTTNPETGEASVSPSTVTGHALQVRPNQADREAYVAEGLILSDMLTLLFAPTTYGGRPERMSTVTLGSDTYTVRTVQPLAPDGVDIISRVGVSR